MKNMIKMLLLAAAVTTAVQCSKSVEEPADGPDKPTDKTVTLTVRSASVSQSKTMLGDGGQVFWENGDEINVNGTVYPVIPDADDPTLATIPDVVASDSYLAMTPGYDMFTEGENLYFYISNMQPYREDSFSADINPMAAYSETTDMYFRNLAGILRIGITGSAAISRITLSSNGDEALAGYFGAPMDDIISGNLQNYSEHHPAYYSSHNITMETGDAFVLDQSTPRYAYFVIPAGTYEYGFSVSIKDTEGNAMIQTTEKTITVGRSEILPMEDFEYAPLEDVVLELTGSTPTSVDYTVVAEPGQSVAQTALTRTWWDSLRETNAEIPEDELNALLLRDFWISWEEVPESGTFTHTLEKAYNGNGYLSEMTAMTEYVILAGYYNSGEIVGTVQMCHATTAEAEGPAPELDLSLLTTGFRDYAEFGATIRTTDAADIKCYATTRADYDNKTGAGLDDRTILIDFGLSVGEENVATANTGGLEWYWTSGIQPETEYMILVMAVGESGMETIKTMTHSTPAYLPEDGNWQTVSTDGYMECGLLSSLTGGSQMAVSGLTIEKYGQYDIFRIQNPFYDFGQNNPEFVETIDGCITLDARSGNVILESFANHIGLVYIADTYVPEVMYLISEPLFDGGGTYGYYDADAGMIDFGNVITCDNYFIFNDTSVSTRLWFENPGTGPDPDTPGLSLEGFVKRVDNW